MIKVTRRRDRETGLHNVPYELLDQNELTIDGAPCTVYNVKLICDYNLTPWCSLKLNATSAASNKQKIKLNKKKNGKT